MASKTPSQGVQFILHWGQGKQPYNTYILNSLTETPFAVCIKQDCFQKNSSQQRTVVKYTSLNKLFST